MVATTAAKMAEWKVAMTVDSKVGKKADWTAQKLVDLSVAWTVETKAARKVVRMVAMMGEK